MKVNPINTFQPVLGSQIGAWASKQSSQIKSQSHLLSKYNDYSKKFENKEVPRPNYWVGIKIIPTEYEFGKEESLECTKEKYTL